MVAPSGSSVLAPPFRGARLLRASRPNQPLWRALAVGARDSRFEGRRPRTTRAKRPTADIARGMSDDPFAGRAQRDPRTRSSESAGEGRGRLRWNKHHNCVSCEQEARLHWYEQSARRNTPMQYARRNTPRVTRSPSRSRITVTIEDRRDDRTHVQTRRASRSPVALARPGSSARRRRGW